MAIDTENKRWAALRASGPPTSLPLVFNPDGSGADDESQRGSILGYMFLELSDPFATLSGTGINVDWTVIRDTGGTIVITLTDDTYIAAGTGPIGTVAQSDAFVQSFVASTSPAAGWNNQISLDNTDLVRTSNTEATITIPATAGYDPQTREIITGTVQAAILTTHGSDISAGSFSISISGALGPLSISPSGSLSRSLSA